MPRVTTAHALRVYADPAWVIPTSGERGEVPHTITLTRPGVTHP